MNYLTADMQYKWEELRNKNIYLYTTIILDHVNKCDLTLLYDAYYVWDNYGAHSLKHEVCSCRNNNHKLSGFMHLRNRIN